VLACFAPKVSLSSARRFKTPGRLEQSTLGESSARSAMSIAKLCCGNQAPLGAACPPASSGKPNMPLLTELENSLVEQPCYKHGAPTGAYRFAVAPARGDGEPTLQPVGPTKAARGQYQ